jgi:hypothetical protein
MIAETGAYAVRRVAAGLTRPTRVMVKQLRYLMRVCGVGQLLDRLPLIREQQKPGSKKGQKKRRKIFVR